MSTHQTYTGPAIFATAKKKAKVVIVVAIGKNRELGKDGKLLWHIPDDLKRFKEQTKGHPVVMGRKTFESIVSYIGKPLPERPNIVISRDEAWTYPGVTVVRSLESALEIAHTLDEDEIHIGGGANVYEQVLPQVDELRLTLVEDEQDADTFFPPFEMEFTKETFREEHEHDGLKYTWVNLTR